MNRSILALLLLFPLTACGQPSALEVEDVWARATVAGQANAAVFMTISATTADRLVAASTPVAGKTDLMTMRGGSSAMEMAYVSDIAVPAGQPVTLDPAGLHVWLAGLRRPLEAGEAFPLTLEFEHAGRREVTVTVIAPAAPPPRSAMTMQRGTAGL